MGLESLGAILVLGKKSRESGEFCGWRTIRSAKLQASELTSPCRWIVRVCSIVRVTEAQDPVQNQMVLCKVRMSRHLGCLLPGS